MFSKEMPLLPPDREALKILKDFLPPRIFDAHLHLFDASFTPRLRERLDPALPFCWERYEREMGELLNFPSILQGNFFVDPDPAQKEPEMMKKADRFLIEQLEKAPQSTAEILVSPEESPEQIEARLRHPRIKGLKCYHLLADRPNTAQADIWEYLPESAWEVAEKRGLAITLHLVKDAALSDPENLRYIREKSRQYPNAVLILAHAARAFASWTGVEAVEKLANAENVWFDFAAVCESPAMLRILQKIDRKRILWGSDYPICRARGKVVSLADGFLWMYQNQLSCISPQSPVKNWLIAIENLMAVRQAALLADWNEDAVEDLFYGNARALFF